MITGHFKKYKFYNVIHKYMPITKEIEVLQPFLENSIYPRSDVRLNDLLINVSFMAIKRTK
jgi:hypothetical protein